MKTFLGFPGEVRNQIYNIALVEAPPWQRRHGAFCAYDPMKRSDAPIPPYALTIQHTQDKLPTCLCAKRQALGILRSCRQVNREAGSIFWSQIAFIFKSYRDFVTSISETRDSTCQLLTGVVILNYLRQPDVQTNNLNKSKSHRLWAAIFRLRGLRVLQLDPGYLDFEGTYAKKIPLCLPNLGSI